MTLCVDYHEFGRQLDTYCRAIALSLYDWFVAYHDVWPVG